MTFTLSPEQVEAIEIDTDKLCIIACAGSGKTSTLTRRIANIINRGDIEPSDIAAITFTVLAADRLRYELRTLLGSGKYSSKMFIGTIHAFCANILREFKTPNIAELRILAEGQQFILLDQFWHEWGISRLGPNISKGVLLRRLLESINLAKMERIAIENLMNDNPIFYEIFIKYNKFLKEASLSDFADLVLDVMYILKKDKELKKYIGEKYKWLFIDEYQDVDDVQSEIFSIIADMDGNHVCVVGDDDQSIYQFRGTDVRILLRFARRKSVDTTYLKVNYRCPRNILAIAKNCVHRINTRLSKEIFSYTPGGRVICRQFERIEEEIEYIVKTIMDYRASGICKSYGDISILMRSVASYGKCYIDALRDSGIPYVTRGDRGLFERPEIKVIVLVCEWVVKDEHILENMVLLQDVLGLNPAAEWDIPLETDIFELSKEECLSLGMSEEKYRTFNVLLSIREKYNGGRFATLLEIILLIIEALKLCRNASDAEMYNIASLTQIVFDFDEIRQTRHLTQLCAYFSMYASHSYDEAIPIETELEAVKVLTIHQAKGLEYDHVFIPMLVDKRFPTIERDRSWLINKTLFPSYRYLSKEEDERRLFYVASTRAKKSLHLLCSRDVGINSLKKPSIFFKEAQNVILPDGNNFPNEGKKYADTKTPYLITSYSALEYYLTCPFRYKLMKIYGIANPINPFFEFGRIIHAVLYEFHESLLDRNPMSAEEVTTLYNNIFTFRYNVPKYVLEKRKRAGLNGILRYLKEKNQWLSQVKTTEKDFELVRGRCLLRGRIDLIIGNEKTGITIIDFKTGEPHEYLRTDFQMQVYALAAMDDMGMRVNRTSLYYLEMEKELTYDVDNTFIEDAETTLMEVIDGIFSKRFDPTPGPVCTRCEVRKFCPVQVDGEIQ